MRSEARLVLLLAATGMILFVPGGHAQDAGLVGHVEGHAASAEEDPAAFAANATTPEWQRGEFNFTVSWACDVSEATPARDALDGLGACEALQDVAAEEQDEEDEDHAHAEELNEADEAVAEAEALAEEAADGVTAVAELLDDTAADPLNILAHLEKFAKRLLEIVGAVLGGIFMLALAVPLSIAQALVTAAEVVVDIAEGILAGLTLSNQVTMGAGEALGDGVVAAGAAAIDGIAEAGTATGSAVANAASDVGDAVSSAANAVTSFVGDLLGGRPSGPVPDDAGLEDGAAGTVGDATGLVDGLVESLPV